MKSGKLLRHLLALVGYALLTVFFCRPISSHLSTHIIGPCGGESSVGLWSIWHFDYAVKVLHSNPFWTDHQYWPYGANLILHNYSPAAGLLGTLLMSALNIEATYNLLFMSSLVLAGYGVFLLLMDWEVDWKAAFAAGLVFAFSPVMDNELIVGGGLDRMGIHTLPFFVWTFSRAIRDGKLRDAALASLCLTWVWGYQYKYFLFCMMLVPFFFFCLNKPIRLSAPARPQTPMLRLACRIIEILATLALALALRSVWGGQPSFRGSGDFHALATYVAPYLAFWGLLGARLLIRRSFHVEFDWKTINRHSLTPYVSTLGFWTLLNLPMIASVVFFMHSGDYGGPNKPWRGGGGAFNPLPMFLPSLTHPLWGDWMRSLAKMRHLALLDSYSLGLVALAAAAWLWRHPRKDRWVSLWFAGFVFSFAMTLGPWLKVLSVHTFLPLPFYFIHLLPIFTNLQNGMNFNVFETLFLALLFGASLHEMMRRLPAKAASWAAAAALGLLAFELYPAKRDIYPLAPSPLFHRLAKRPDGALLTIPTGAVFDALDADGNRGLVPDLREQIAHHKPRVGGFLGRISARTYRTMLKDPYWMGLVAAQSGGEVPPALRDPRLVADYLKKIHVTYIIVDASHTAPTLQRAIAGWKLRQIDEEGPLRLYVSS